MRLFKPNLAKMITRKDVAGLTKLLDEKEPQLRLDTVRALGTIGDTRAFEALKSVLESNDYDLIKAAADIINVDLLDGELFIRWTIAKGYWSAVTLTGEKAVGPIIAAMKYDSAKLRKEAAGALGVLQSPKGVDPLIEALEDPSAEVVDAAAKALIKIGDTKALGAVIKALSAALEDFSYSGHICSNSRRERAFVLFYAVQSIERIEAVDLLVEAVNHCSVYNSYFLLAAIISLGRIGSERATETVIKQLDHEIFNFRAVAAEALGKIGDERAIKPLIDTLKDRDFKVRKAAAEALDKIGFPYSPEDYPWLVVAKGEWNEAVSIGNLAVEPLSVAIKDDNMDICKAAAEALEKIGLPDNLELQVWHAIAKRNWKYLVAIGAPAVEPLMIALERNKVYDSCCSIIEALVLIGGDNAITASKRVIEDALKQHGGPVHLIYEVYEALSHIHTLEGVEMMKWIKEKLITLDKKGRIQYG